MRDTNSDLVTCVAKALANHEQTEFGVVRLYDSEGVGTDVDTRPSYRREAKRFIAMLNAVLDWKAANQ